MNKIALISKLV